MCSRFRYFAKSDRRDVKRMVIISFIVALLIQLLLCLKVRSRIIRLLPIIGFFIFGLYCVWGIIITPSGWDFGRLSYLIVAVYCMLQIILCGAVWGISVLIKRIKCKREVV